jgi:hypothetical protein
LRDSQRLSVDETRAILASKLLKAIEISEQLAVKAKVKVKPEKGDGGVAAKARWYQLMAYLSQTLNGVLQNQYLNETRARVAELMKQVAEIRKPAKESPG